MTFKERLQLTPEQVTASKVTFTVNKIARKFDADIDANQSRLEDLQAELEAQLNSADCSPVKCAELVIEIEQFTKVVAVLRNLKADLFPVAA